MQRPADLLVEEDASGEALDARVRANRELAQVARASVAVELAQQVVLVLARPRRDDLALPELELDPLNLAPGPDRRVAELHPAADRVFDRAGEDLAARHVVFAV